MSADKNKLNTHLLWDKGQSPWIDDISKCWIDSGELKEMVYKRGVRGMTTNPTIFQKAISSGKCGYPDEIQKALQKTSDPVEVYEILTSNDVRSACDIMQKLYDESEGVDGFVSWEEAPEWGRNEEKAVSEAHRLSKIINRPNLFVKVPSTPEGVKALRRLIRDGISINMTLIFDRAQYNAVAEAYISGLEDRLSDGKPIDKVRSVASVFISRIDTQVDNALDEHSDSKSANELKGKIGIANCKLIYQDFQRLFNSKRFKPLAEKGAKVQRPLWASTGTKNPDYSDVLYIDNLVGADTVNTMPLKTLEAFLDHGKVAESPVTKNVDEAENQIKRLESMAISLTDINSQLLDDGLDAFAKSYNDLIAEIQKSMEVVHER